MPIAVSRGSLHPLTVANIKLCVRASESMEEEKYEGWGLDGSEEGLVEGSFVQLIRENVELFFESGKGTKEGYEEWKRGDEEM